MMTILDLMNGRTLRRIRILITPWRVMFTEDWDGKLTECATIGQAGEENPDQVESCARLERLDGRFGDLRKEQLWWYG